MALIIKKFDKSKIVMENTRSTTKIIVKSMVNPQGLLKGDHINPIKDKTLDRSESRRREFTPRRGVDEGDDSCFNCKKADHYNYDCLELNSRECVDRCAKRDQHYSDRKAMTTEINEADLIYFSYMTIPHMSICVLWPEKR